MAKDGSLIEWTCWLKGRRASFTGIGKPEPLKYELAGKWSRRINAEHRLVYSVEENQIEVYLFSMR